MPHPPREPLVDTPSAPVQLEQLLRRADLWRGRVQAVLPQGACSTGFAPLDAALLHKGWPLGCLIEICQESAAAVDWYLCAHGLKGVKGGIALLNPPNVPFAQGLIQLGIDLERLVIVRTDNQADFVQSFVELSSRDVCGALMAWQPQQALSYAQVRKCLLATAQSAGLSFLFRPAIAGFASSPASLRLQLSLKAAHVQVRILKQRGMLPTGDACIDVALPARWQAQVPHHQGQTDAPARMAPAKTAPQSSAKTLIFTGRRL